MMAIWSASSSECAEFTSRFSTSSSAVLRIKWIGIVDVNTFIIDKKIALVYKEGLAGDGDIEIDSERAISEKASKLQRMVAGEKDMPLNFFESTKIAYSGLVPLSGEKQIKSKAFYGIINANVKEAFSPFVLDRTSSSFLAIIDVTSGMNNGTEMAILKSKSPTILVRIDTKNGFKGAWGTDSYCDENFQKNILAHQRFSGTFEAEKLIKLHEHTVPGVRGMGCDGIDC
jgi:hypothetical protein